MLNIFMHALTGQPVFQIQHRKHILIRDFSAFIRNLGKRLLSAVFQQAVIYFIDILFHIHPVELFLKEFSVLLFNIPSPKRFICVNKVLHHRVHPLEDRGIIKLVIKKMDHLLLRQMHSPEIYIAKIHQAVFLQSKKPFYLTCKFRRLFPAESFLRFRIREPHHPLQMIISVLAVRRSVFQFSICKKIKAHLPDIFLPQFRKNVGNIICKYTVR